MDYNIHIQKDGEMDEFMGISEWYPFIFFIFKRNSEFFRFVKYGITT